MAINSSFIFSYMYAHFLSPLITIFFFRQSLWRESAFLTANCCNQLYIELQYGSSDFRILGLFLSHVSWLILYYCHLKFTEDWHRAWAFTVLGCGKPKVRMSKSWIHFTFMMHHFNLYSCIVPSFDLICPWQCQ